MDQNWLNSELNQELLDPARDSTPAFRTWEFSHFAFLSIQRDATCNKKTWMFVISPPKTQRRPRTERGVKLFTPGDCLQCDRVRSASTRTLIDSALITGARRLWWKNRKHLSGRANFGPLLSAILWRTLKFRTPACRYFPIRPSLRARLK